MQTSNAFKSRRTEWIVCAVVVISVLATIWSTLILFRTVESNRRTTASLFPLLGQSQSFEREILNARIAFIYHVTLQKPGSLESGWEHYGRAQADLDMLEHDPDDSGTASVLLKPPQEALRLAWQAYDHRLRAVLAMVAEGNHAGADYNRQVSAWADEGSTLVNAAHDLSDVTIALSRAQSRSTAFFLRLALVIVNANGALWLMLGGAFFWLRSRSFRAGCKALPSTSSNAVTAQSAARRSSRLMVRSRVLFHGFSTRACAAVLFMLASVCIVLGTGLFALRGIEHLTSAQSGSMHSQQVLIDAESLRALASEAESDTRGFVFSGRSSLLISQQNEMHSAWDLLHKLRLETAGDAQQQRELQALSDNLQRRFRWLTYTSSVRQTAGPEAVTRLFATGNPLGFKQDLENSIALFESMQYRLLVTGALESEHAAVISKTLILFAAFPAALGLGFLGVVTIHLLTRGTRLQERLTRLNDTLQAVLGTAPVAIASFGPAAELQFCNGAAEHLFGVCRGAETVSSFADTPGELADLVRRLAGSLEKDAAGDTTSLQVQWPAAAGAVRTLHISAARVANGEDGQHGIVAIAQDMTEQMRLQEQLAFQANHDVLTGLPNRFSLDERFENMLADAERTGTRCAVFGMDLDHFKQVNDRYGHVVGDLFLRKVTERLASVLRKSDTLVRVGGDEFLCLAEALHTAQDADVIAAKLIDSLARPVEIEGTAISASVSIGIAVYPDDASDAEELRKKADAALYRAKTAGRNLFCRFVQSEAENRNELIQGCLQTALQENRFRLVYQPQVTPHGVLRGFEALLRLDHPALGPVSPAEFIPLAEKSRLILPIGTWVLEQACATYADWAARGLHPGVLAVNVSAPQFARRDFSEQVVKTLRQANLQPGCLELELTESMMMCDPHESDRQMRRLERAGVRLAIDDFGTGYSSLSHLNHLPINTLKVDRSFVRQLEAGVASRSIIEAIVALGKALSMEVIAEGVETEEQRACVTALGCDYLQGFLFAKPLELEAAEQLLQRDQLRVGRGPACLDPDTARQVLACA